MKLNCFLCTVAFATIAMPAIAQDLAGNRPNVFDCTAEANKEYDGCLGLPLANGAPLKYQSIAGPVIGGQGITALLGATGGTTSTGTTSTGSTGSTGTN